MRALLYLGFKVMARGSQIKHVDFIYSDDPRCLPCPWCGKWKDEDGIALDILFDYWYKIRCLNCLAMPYSCSSNTVEAAINFWNTRNQPASLEDAKLLIRKVVTDLSKAIE